MSLDFSDIVCTPSRKPVKFSCGSFARHSLFFDSAISREDRHLIFLEVFACTYSLVPDSPVFVDYPRPRYSPDDYVELRVVTDHRHPVYGQIGLYAKKTIPSNTIVTSYSGFLEVFGSSCNSRTYTMGFGTIGDDFALDAEFAGNHGRFANDPRGVIGLSANLIAENRFNARGEAFTALVSRRQIMEGEEILMSYGKAHSLGATPWTNAEGDPVFRYRSSGMIPFSLFENLSAVSHGEIRKDEEKQLSYNLMWECPQCGTWSFWGKNEQMVSCCEKCSTPKPAGCPLVSVLGPLRLPEEGPPGSSSPLNAVSLSPSLKRGANAEQSTAEAFLSCKQRLFSEPAGSNSFYDSTKVEWPLSVPFLPWQVWDPTVPIATVLKHSRFESQEHLFLYRVTSSLAAAKEIPEKQQFESTPVLKEEGTERDTKRTRKRERQQLGKMWERCELGSTNLAHNFLESSVSLPQRPLRRDDTKLRANSSESTFFSAPFFAAGPSSSVFRSSLCSTPGLDLSGGINRFLLLRRSSNVFSARHVKSAREGLLQICCRLFTGKSFNQGELVGFVGGVIRTIDDSRCRPDSSPLEIPMKYFLPWRSDPAFYEQNCESKTEKAQGTSPTDNLFKAKLDLLKRFSSLALVVTNEMMYCPCLAIEDETFCGKNDSLATELEMPVESTAERVNCALSSKNALRGANVTFILTTDSLGCPFVACVAITRLCAFEPLLATFL